MPSVWVTTPKATRFWPPHDSPLVGPTVLLMVASAAMSTKEITDFSEFQIVRQTLLRRRCTTSVCTKQRHNREQVKTCDGGSEPNRHGAIPTEEMTDLGILTWIITDRSTKYPVSYTHLTLPTKA